MRTDGEVRQFANDVGERLSVLGHQGLSMSYLRQAQPYPMCGVGFTINRGGKTKRHAVVCSEGLTVAECANDFALVLDQIAATPIEPFPAPSAGAVADLSLLERARADIRDVFSGAK